MKFGSKVSITVEAVAKALGLPEDVRVDYAGFNADRGIVTFYLTSSEEVDGVTFALEEAQERQNIALNDE